MREIGGWEMKVHEEVAAFVPLVILGLGIIGFVGGIAALVVTSVDIASWSIYGKVAIGSLTAAGMAATGLLIWGPEL